MGDDRPGGLRERGLDGGGSGERPQGGGTAGAGRRTGGPLWGEERWRGRGASAGGASSPSWTSVSHRLVPADAEADAEPVSEGREEREPREERRGGSGSARARAAVRSRDLRTRRWAPARHSEK